jgi:hypothetical protein
MTTEEPEIIDALERGRGGPLTPEETNLSLEQALALREIADNVVPIKAGGGVTKISAHILFPPSATVLYSARRG